MYNNKVRGHHKYGTHFVGNVSRFIENPTPRNGMILAPDCKNQIQVILMQDSTPTCNYLLTVLGTVLYELPPLWPLH